jgi:hypothetical protein
MLLNLLIEQGLDILLHCGLHEYCKERKAALDSPGINRSPGRTSRSDPAAAVLARKGR